MHCTRKDGAQHNPKVGSRAKLRTHDGAVDGTQTCDVQELNHKYLPGRHGNVIHTILTGKTGSLAIRVRLHNGGNKLAVKQIAQNQSS